MKYKFLYILALIAAIAIGVFFGLKSQGIDLFTNSSSEKTFSTSYNPIDNDLNIKLNQENFDKISKNFSENNKDSDDLYYYTYAFMYYSFKAYEDIDSFNDMENIDTNQKMYGKTINELINDGKQLMKDDNTTIEEYKKSLKELENNSTNDDMIYLNE
ncbi:MAG: hypothetical protein IJ629_06205 [Clostridia bacterium]|nr:hypothetical protein [Clostridia bacterium]